ncbi:MULTISPECIES: uracil-xanthine permease family protein [Salimicrobium]|uniref:Uracil permease n=2 Tax=Salimicrobium TaxID=351195 RepID=A0ABY1KPL4_9BACI|nr:MULTISPECIES: solute carrier family 23 protein [Salimicrobium]SDX33317.1 uracil permease [Salimicrobium album]SIS61923.1 uracil permease [Salimicrobium salexigens]
MNDREIVYDVEEKPAPAKWLALSLQHLFAMFGATILVPFLTGLSPSVALVASGTGTLAYLLITRGKVPAYLGSSFAFIYPITQISESSGVAGAMVGSFLAGLVYGAASLLIMIFGVKWLTKLLPPVVVGPVIMVIGLGLASTAVDMAMYEPGSDKVYSTIHITTALVTLGATIIAMVFLRGIFRLIPILIGITTGYTFALVNGVVDTSGIQTEWENWTGAESFTGFLQAFFRTPDFLLPFIDYSPFSVLSLDIAMVMMPFALVTLAEHTGDQMVLSKVTGRNFLKNPGLDKTILGDGAATMIASMLGGPPNTTYGENIGVLAVTRVFSVFVIGLAAVMAIVFGWIGMVTVLISSIPQAVMGGVSILLFGVIAASGLRMMIDHNVNLGDNRNLVITSVILVIGVGGAFIRLSPQVELGGMALAALTGIVLNLIIPQSEEEKQQKSVFEKDEEIA